LTSTTAAATSLAASAVASQATLTSSATALSASVTSSLTASTSSASRSLTLSTSTSSTSLTTSATTGRASSVNSLVTSLSTAASAAAATSSGQTFAPIQNVDFGLPVVGTSAPNVQNASMVISVPSGSGQYAGLAAVAYQVFVVQLIEYDSNQLEVASCPQPSGQFTYSTYPGVANTGAPTTVFQFTGPLCGGTHGQLTVTFTQYTSDVTLTFAGLPINVVQGSLKVEYEVDNWNFQSPSNTLEVQLQLQINGSDTYNAISSYVVPTSINNILLWEIQLQSYEWISATVLSVVLIDGVAYDATIWPTNGNNLQLSVLVPYFSRSLQIDPNFDVLLDSRTSPNSKKSSNVAAIASGVSVGIVLLLVIGLVVAYFIIRRNRAQSFGSSSGGVGGSRHSQAQSAGASASGDGL